MEENNALLIGIIACLWEKIVKSTSSPYFSPSTDNVCTNPYILYTFHSIMLSIIPCAASYHHPFRGIEITSDRTAIYVTNTREM